MCGRFTLTFSIDEVAQAFDATPAGLESTPRYNIAPTQQVVAVMQDAERHLALLRWGLIPSWAKEEAIGAKMINARAETLAEKPSFKRLLHSRRCLIVADGFYEWRQEHKGKTPMYIALKERELFAFAGLWDTWRNSAGEHISTCTIITTEPNELVASIHNRMPVILTPQARSVWLDPTQHDERQLLPLLQPYAASAMSVRAVSRQVNDPRYDSAELLA